MKTRWFLMILVAAVGVAAYAGSVLATNPSGVTTTFVVNKAPLGEIDVKTNAVRHHRVTIKTKGDSDLYVVRNVFAPATNGAPGGQTGWHTHAGPSLITVTAGQITAYDADDPTCTPKVYGQGQVFVDPGDGHVHLLRNETSEPAETIAVQILPRDAERADRTPPAPPSCGF